MNEKAALSLSWICMTQVELRCVAVHLSIVSVLLLCCSIQFSFYFFSADGVVSVLQARQQQNWGPIPSRGRVIFSPQLPDQLWAPLSIPFSGDWRPIPQR